MTSLRISRSRREAGFSLIELMMTLVLLAVMAGLAMPSMRGYIDRTAVDSAVNELSGDIAYAQMLAVRSGAGATLTITTTGYTVRHGSTNAVAKTATLADENARLAIAAVNPLSLPLILDFDSRGLLRSAAQAGRLRMQLGQLGSTLRILPSGRSFRE